MIRVLFHNAARGKNGIKCYPPVPHLGWLAGVARHHTAGDNALAQLKMAESGMRERHPRSMLWESESQLDDC